MELFIFFFRINLIDTNETNETENIRLRSKRLVYKLNIFGSHISSQKIL